MAKINSKTALKEIKEMAIEDFGVKLTNEQAKDIKEAIRGGSAKWTAESYVSVTNSPTIKRMSRKGVGYLAYGTFYTTKEWNEAYQNL